jgi:selenocysteine-specific elongation factor
VEALVATDDALTVVQGCVRARDHAGTASATAAGRALLDAVRAAPFAPPAPPDVALARALAREGALVEVGGIYFAVEALDDARDRVVAALLARGTLTIADARDVLGSSRKYVVPIMNHLDATGVTRRRGDDRIAGPRSGLAADERP